MRIGHCGDQYNRGEMQMGTSGCRPRERVRTRGARWEEVPRLGVGECIRRANRVANPSYGKLHGLRQLS